MRWKIFAGAQGSKIVQTISIWYIAIFISLFLIGIIAVPAIFRLDSIAKDIYTHPFIVGNAATELQYEISLMRNIMLKSFFSENQNEIKKLLSEVDEIDKQADKNIKVIQENFLGDKAKVNEIGSLLEKWREIRKKEFNYLLGEDKQRAANLRNRIDQEIYIPINILVTSLVNSERHKVVTFVLESESTMNLIIVSLVFLIFLILISGFFILVRVVKIQKESEHAVNIEREQYLIEARIFAEEELLRNKNKLKILADNVPAIVSMVDQNLKFQFVNKRFVEIFKTSSEECIGRNVKDIIGDKIFSKVEENYKFALKGTAITFESIFELKDGQERYFEIKYTPFIEDDEQTGVIVLSHDITDRKHSEINLLKAKEEAEIANRLKSEFLANMSHEIRTPMNAILGFSEILKDKIGKDPLVLDYLSGIQKSGKNLISLINDILDLAKIEAGKLEIVYSPVNLFAVIHDIQQIFSLQTIQKNLKFEITIDEKLPKSILIDELRLRQVLFNLIGNAVKFTEKGGVYVNVLHLSRGSDSSCIDLVIDIKDTGIGIAEYELDAIFSPFIQQAGQDAMRFGGSGLGLSITRKLVEMMGGTITVESKIGLGSTFRVHIPELEISSLTHNSKEKDFEIANISFDKAKILLVEDIESNRKVVTGFLEQWNFTILEAANGRLALEILEKESVDLILMDMQMPEMDGKTTSLIIKKNDRLKSIPILVLTATSLKEVVEDILTFADGYLCKPITRVELIRELARFLPHNKNNPTMQESNANPDTLLKEISNSIFANPLSSDLIYRLKNWFHESESARKSLQTNKLIFFVSELIRIGVDSRLTPLVQFSSDLLQLIKSFSIPDVAYRLQVLEKIQYNILHSSEES